MACYLESINKKIYYVVFVDSVHPLVEGGPYLGPYGLTIKR